MAAQGSLNSTHKIDNENVRTIHLGIDAETLARELKQESGLRFTAESLNGTVFVPYMSIQNESFSVFPLFAPKAEQPDMPTASPTAPAPTASAKQPASTDDFNAAWLICGGALVAAGGAAAAVAVKKKRKS